MGGVVVGKGTALAGGKGSMMSKRVLLLLALHCCCRDERVNVRWNG